MRRFADRGSEDVANGVDTKAARSSCPRELWPVARRKLDLVLYAGHLGDLRSRPGNRFEALKGERDGQYSIRVNARYRVCFTWSDQGAQDIEIVDYH